MAAEAVLRQQLKFKTNGAIKYVFHSNGKRFGEVKTAWHKALKRAGLPAHIRFHDLKHTAVSRMIMAGQDAVTVGRIAGWADNTAAQMLRRYAHLSKEHLHDAAKALDNWRLKHKLSTSCEIRDISEVAEKRIKAV